MKHRICYFAVIFQILVITSTAQQQQALPQVSDTKTTAELVAVRDAIRDASRSGDVIAWNRLVSPDCHFVEPNGRITNRSWHAPSERSSKPASDRQPAPEVRLSQPASGYYGDTAVLTYREDSKSKVGDATIVSIVRFTEVYRRDANRWVLIASAETPISEKKAASVDQRIYDDYVGEYQMAPELVGKVYRQGDRLMLIGTGWKQAYELSPLGHDTFFVKEMPDNEIVFIRDAAGKVVAQGPGENSQGPTGKKVK